MMYPQNPGAQNDYELLSAKVKNQGNDIADLRRKVDGDKSVVNGGGTGLIGKTERLKREFYKFEDDVKGVAAQVHRLRDEMTISGRHRDEQLKELAAKVDEIEKRMHPHWWDVVIVSGGFGILVMLFIQLLEMFGILG